MLFSFVVQMLEQGALVVSIIGLKAAVCITLETLQQQKTHAHVMHFEVVFLEAMIACMIVCICHGCQ